MKKTILSICTLLLVVLCACAQQKKGTKKKKTSTTTAAKTNITVIEMTRGACFGKCPEYTLRVAADGNATYTGRRNAPYQGVYTKQLDAAKVVALFNDYERYRVDTCSEKYKILPDLPGLEYNIYYNTKEQRIQNANSPFAPKFLNGLADQMDKLANVDNSWKRTGDVPSNK